MVDNCIISSLSKIGRLELLKRLDGVSTSLGVIREIRDSKVQGLIADSDTAIKKWLSIKAVKEESKVSALQEGHPGLSYVDCELVSICRESGSILMTDDSHLINIAENRFGLRTVDLFEFLIALKHRKVLNRSELTMIISDLEKKDRYSFSKDRVKKLLK